PDARKVHASPTPRGGGMAFAGAFYLIVLGLLFFDTLPREIFNRDVPETSAMLLGAAGFFLIGLLDDIWTLRSQIKFLLLLAVAAAVCFSGLRIETITLGSWGHWPLGALAWPVTMLWIVGITVSINFADGLDGLAAGIAAIAASLIAIVGYTHGQPLVVIPALALTGSLVGFLVFNFHPARIFMGDCGSLFVGFLLSTLSIMHAGRTNANEMTLGPALTALALGVPVLDAMFTFFRRGVLQRRSVFAAEDGHIHHHLLRMGFKHHQAVLLLYGVSLVSALSGVILLLRRDAFYMLVVAAILVLPLLLLFKVTGYVQFGKIISAVRRNLLIGREDKNYRAAFEQMQLRFAHIDNFEKWWTEVCAAADMMDVVRIALPLPARNGPTQVREWERQGFTGKDVLRLIVPIRQRRIGGPLRANVEVDAADSLEAAGRRLTFFARLLEEHSIASLPEVARAPKSSQNVSEVASPCLGSNGHNGNGHAHLPEPRLPGVRVAVVHDFLYTYAGAERVLEQIIQVFPQAELFSLFDFLPEGQRDFIMNKPV
ncbi:MAG: glycosyl transferase family 1, partial [Phycisphaerae bacterium]